MDVNLENYLYCDINLYKIVLEIFIVLNRFYIK